MILALDIGITTGYAVLFEGRKGMDAVEEHGTIYADVFGLVLPQLIQDNEPDQIVIEDPLLTFRGVLADALRSVDAVARSVCPRAVHVTPAQWKPTPWGKHPLPSGLTAHERDAIRLGLWFRQSLETRLQGL